MFANLLTKAQRLLLTVLVEMRRPLSVLDLSRLAEMPYATTHATLRRLKRAHLVVSTSVKGRSLYSANLQDEDARALTTLLLKDVSKASLASSLDIRSVTDEEVLWNLAELGAPLAVADEPHRTLPLETTLALSLRVVRRNPTVALVLPQLLSEHLSRTNFARLRFLAKEAGETRALGFFLDLTGVLARKPRLCERAKDLLDRRVKRPEAFFTSPSNRYATMLANRKSPPLARKWHFTMNMEMNAFRSHYEKFRHGATKI